LLKILFRIEIQGEENLPQKGPLLIVGNHTGAMEVVLLNAFAPWQIEMLSAADMPTERITEIMNVLYGSIPIRRGSYDRMALNKALEVLDQDGFVGLFPEGGVWDIGKQKALPGISWLSYRSNAPILPVGFNDTAGAMDAGLKGKRPWLKMFIGEALPAAKVPEGMAKKVFFQQHADEVMEMVYSLVPDEDALLLEDIAEESFDMDIMIMDLTGQSIKLPVDLEMKHPSQLARFLHLPHILDIFTINLELPIEPIKNLGSDPPVDEILRSVKLILTYLRDENPYLLTYRFGVPEGLGMGEGLVELKKILEWCTENQYQISITPVHKYISITEGKEVIRTEQKHAQPWM
jgi:1-acyl-sn-glycerol-3-phosphate acyltransferase